MSLLGLLPAQAVGLRFSFLALAARTVRGVLGVRGLANVGTRACEAMRGCVTTRAGRGWGRSRSLTVVVDGYMN